MWRECGEGDWAGVRNGGGKLFKPVLTWRCSLGKQLGNAVARQGRQQIARTSAAQLRGTRAWERR